MIAVDTNVLVRIPTRDDPPQVRRAVSSLRGQEIWLSKTVLLETEWVLRYTYELSRVARPAARIVRAPRVQAL